MSLPHRIAGGAIVIHDDAVLLVRYRNGDGTTYLAAPGGGALNHESAADAAVRETFEETAVQITPRRVLLIEDIVATRFKCCKIWFACDLVSGEVTATDGARTEGIIEARWFRRADLEAETVYPWIVQARDWASFWDARYVTEFSPSRLASF
jgi:ADP-ribose pyrophosphatase YjhB (NUDIX family)